jgi:hypothetical protein
MRDTIDMAREANLLFPGVDVVDGSIDQLKRFEALVRADEREACAQIAWNMEPDENGPIEAAIRARGNT